MRARVVTALVVSTLMSLVSAAQAEDAKPASKPKPAKTATRSDVSVGAALARLEDGVSLAPPVATPNGGPARSGGPVTLGGDLSQINVTKTGVSDAAGEARDVTVTTDSASKSAKPVATARALRRMNADRVVSSLAPAFAACQAAAPPAKQQRAYVSTAFTDDVAVAPTVTVTVDVSGKGDVEGAELASVRGAVPPTVAQCIVSSFTPAHFGAPGGIGVRITLPVALRDAPRAEAPRPAPAVAPAADPARTASAAP